MKAKYLTLAILSILVFFCNCQMCPVGYSSDANGNPVAPCPDGYYAPLGMCQCYAVPMGFQRTTDRGGVVLCNQSAPFTNATITTCSVCPAGIINLS